MGVGYAEQPGDQHQSNEGRIKFTRAGDTAGSERVGERGAFGLRGLPPLSRYSVVRERLGLQVRPQDSTCHPLLDAHHASALACDP